MTPDRFADLSRRNWARVAHWFATVEFTGHDRAKEQDLADFIELLAEVERLQRIVEATNPCPNCGTFNLVRRVLE